MDGSDAETSETAGENGSTGPDPRRFDLSSATVEELAATMQSVETATLNAADRETRDGPLSSVLVAVSGGPHSGATVDFAKALADEADAWVELFHVAPAGDAGGATDAAGTQRSDDPGTDGGRMGDHDGSGADDASGASSAPEARRPNGDRLLDAATDRLGGFERFDRWLVEGDTPADEIVEQSPYYDAVIVGASTTGTVGRFVFGCTTDAVVDAAAVPVIVVEGDGSTALIDGD